MRTRYINFPCNDNVKITNLRNYRLFEFYRIQWLIQTPTYNFEWRNMNNSPFIRNVRKIIAF